MRILVCGGRRFKDYALLRGTLISLCPRSEAPPDMVIIHGGARGADSLADYWATANFVKAEEYKADWLDLSHPDALIKTGKGGMRYDARAGLRRNQRMIDEGKPDLVIAFPGGSGTADMVRRAKKAGIEVKKVNPHNGQLKAA